MTSWAGLPVAMQFARFPQPGVPNAWRLGEAPGAGELGFTDFVPSQLFGEWEPVASPYTTTCSMVNSRDGSLCLITTSGGFVLGDPRNGSVLAREGLPTPRTIGRNA